MQLIRAATLTLLCALTPSLAWAQAPVQFAVSGFGGVFIPANDMFDEIEFDAALRFGQKTGFTFGGRASVWLTGRVGIEAEAAYSISDGEIRGLIPGDVTVDTTLSGAVFMGSLNVMFAVIKPPLEPLSIYVSGGLGIVSRGGDFIDLWKATLPDFDSGTDIAGVLGIGLRYAVARGVNIRADVRDYISSYNEDDFEADSKLQNDVLVNAGLELFFGGS